MSTQNSPSQPELPGGHPEVYEIRLRGVFIPRWADWFAGLTVVSIADDEFILTVPAVDQAALHGLIAIIRDLNLDLISIVKKS